MKIKEILEKLRVPHIFSDGNIHLTEEAIILFSCLNVENHNVEIKTKKVIQAVKELSGIDLIEKGGCFIGARMGRPEKAKRREMDTKKI